MVTATQVGIRFTEDDTALIRAIMVRTGIMNRTDVVRLAIRRLAAAEGIPLPTPRRSPLIDNERPRDAAHKKNNQKMNK
jgi:hypothetical protein